MKAILLLILLFYICPAFAQSSEWYLPSKGILFPHGAAILSTAAKQRLDTLAIRMQANPDFKVVIESNAGNTKGGLKLSWHRVSVVINYLVERGNIDWQRFKCKPKGMALDNQVFYRQPYQGEEGPSGWKPLK